MYPSVTLPTCVTLTLYPLGKETNKGYVKRVILCSRDMLKVMWLEAPESSIHKSDLFLKHLHDSFPNSIEEVQTMIPAKSIAGPLACRWILHSHVACGIAEACLEHDHIGFW